MKAIKFFIRNLFFLMLIVIVGCKKDPPKTLPVISTSVVTNITSTSATSGGAITDDGNSPVLSRGVCWSTNLNPTITDSKTTDGAGIGTFISSITGLLPGGTYYVRAYATNAVGTAYGDQITVTTPCVLSILTTTELLGISSTTATGGGNITSDGGATIIARGVCWSRNPMPIVRADSTTNNGTGTGVFVSSITGLLPGTTYYIRAYATNSVGTAYGNQITATTNAVLPVLSTTEVSDITPTTAQSGGNITYDGGANIMSRGVCWSNNQSPSILDNKTNDGSGSGNYISNISRLAPGITYYVRAYATNNIGTSYGNQVKFTTTSILPKLTTTEPSNILSTTVTSGGNITSDGGATVTSRGVCWNSNGSPTINDNKITNGSGVGSFISIITGLMPNTTYKIRAYATNSVGTSYGNQVSFATLQGVPTIITNQPTSVTQTSLTTGGIIINDGGSIVLSKGICYSRSQNPTKEDRVVIDWTSNDNFVCTLKNLEPKTTYYIRAFATNLTGTGYGEQVTVTTLGSLATISTNNITNYTATTAVGGGNITSDGGEPITSRGVCWSTKKEPIINDSKTTDGTGIGIFSSSMQSLMPNTKYYVRAYATNSIGTAYGNQVTVTTLSPEATVPVLTTTAPSEITSNSLKSGGVITNDGGSLVFSKGICYSRSQNPTKEDRIIIDWTSNDNFVCTLINLEPKTTYYIRAFATNLTGTGYGEQVTVTTLGSLATIITSSITNYTETTAVGGGNITSDGGEPVTLRGVCWNTKGEPIINDSKTTDGSGIGVFSSSMIGLTPNTKYYVRAYATNSIGTIYGNQVTVTTLSPEPTIATLTTSEVSNITSSSATSGGSITNTGGAIMISHGVCYSRSQNPTINDRTVVDIHTNDNYACTLINLEPKTTYYIRAFATNTAGTAYGNQIYFTTKDDGTVIVGSSENIQHIDASGDFVFRLNSLSNKDVFFVFSNKNTITSIKLPKISGSVSSMQMTKVPIMAKQSKFLVSGKPSISDFNNNPWKYTTTGLTKSQYQQYLATKTENYIVGTTEALFDETGPARMSTVRKVITAHGKNLYVWVDDLCWGTTSTKKHYVTQDMVDKLASKFLNSGTTDDIYEWVTNICGAPWGPHMYNSLIPSTDDIHIWLTDIDGDNNDNGGTTGYFWGQNNFLRTSKPSSNEKLMFVIDAVMFASPDGGTWELSDYWPQKVISTLAHEFHHMIYFYRKHPIKRIL